MTAIELSSEKNFRQGVDAEFFSSAKTYELERIFGNLIFSRCSFIKLLDTFFFAKKIKIGSYFTKILEILL
jgi:hypothetical protein